MSEFSAHRVTIGAGEKIAIVSHVNLYVSTIGDDVVNSGVEPGSPFRSPARALEWLGDKIITETGFVTINVAAGIYDIDEQLVMDHPQGERVAIVGADPEVLILRYVSKYTTYKPTADGASGYYSGLTHEIEMSCCRPDVNTNFSEISADPIRLSHQMAGAGVIIEDHTLGYQDNYNPAVFYASYPQRVRNNLWRQSSLLGCHRLISVNGATLNVQSSIRDNWFLLPLGSLVGSPGYFIGNATEFGGASNDTSPLRNNSTIFPGAGSRKQWFSSVPVGYYGSSAVNGITTGATYNFISGSFPTAAPLNGIAEYQYFPERENEPLTGNYGYTGPAGSFLNDYAQLGPNYHYFNEEINGQSGAGFSAEWASINTNRVLVKIIPTVFRRFGTILSVKSGGLRKVKNIFFDGKSMLAHYNLIGEGRLNDAGSTNKCAIYIVASNAGESVVNEPSNLYTGLLQNVCIQDFHVGVYANRASNVNLGSVAVSNCSYGVLANNSSAINTEASIATGGVFGFCAFNQSNLDATRCFSSFTGQSLYELRLKGNSFDASSYIPGQTFGSFDGKLKGTVYDWDPHQRSLIIAVPKGILEGIVEVI